MKGWLNLKKITALLAFLVLAWTLLGTAMAQVEQDPVLDAAFSMLEADNIFLRRYNELTGAEIEAKFEMGMPYFFGGNDDKNLLLSKYPDYYKRECLETTKFYRAGQKYIFGLDCSGFTRWVYRQAGKPRHDTLSNMILLYQQYAKNYVFTHRDGAKVPFYSDLHKYLQTGDLFVAKHGARHIMMYIGTLSDYGFTAEEVPELADYLDYPLVIHCGPNPFYGQRFEEFIAANKQKYGDCATTDGGVCVSILGVPMEKAPYQVNVQKKDYSYFLIDDGNYMLMLWDVTECTSWCWFRM